ncbi:PQQ-binding-like beta-propeller repeat protein [Actinomadura rugatobispora]|uniref:PQQ-binding-like beta-propeller repeat protein n=1 Tax=Actinomadura rugatobispora TaxID=1994 RepID=A0ABW1ABF9_9ACTN|nr:hypothetical protein GCM10010200_079380 [Actinomadura rugatobispora]
MLRALQGNDPTRIDVYDVLALLGEGGMGRVYLGRDESGRLVAIKKMNELARAGGAHFFDRLRKELKAVERIGADFTPPVRKSCLDPHDPWMAVDYIKAPTLRQLVQQLPRPLPVEAVVWLAGSLLRVLRELAAKGIVHRDLHPANILVRAEGSLVIDFGLARDLARAVTQPYYAFGARGYMAPEQRDGTHPQTPALDVYSLGAVLAFAATGEDPGTSEDWLIERDAAGRPSLPGLPQELHDVVHACMRHRWWERPSLEKLEALVRALPRGGEPDGVALLPTDALGVLRDYAEMPVDDRPEIRQVPRVSEPARAPLGSGERFPVGSSDQYVRPVVEGDVLVVAGLAGVVQGFGRHSGDRLWETPLGGRVESRPAARHGTVVVCGSDHRVYALDAETGKVQWVHGLESTIGSAPEVTDDAVVFGDRAGRLHALDLAGGRRRWSFAAAHSFHARPVIAGGVVYAGSWDRSMYAVGLESGKEEWRRPVRGEIHQTAAVAGGRVFFGSGDHRLHALDAGTGAPLWTFPTGGPVHCEPVVDRGVVYFAGSDGCLYAVRADTGEQKWRALAGSFTSSPVLACGRLWAGSFGTVCSVDAADGGDLRELRVGDAAVLEVALAPDGERGRFYLGTADGQVVIASARTSGGPRR